MSTMVPGHMHNFRSVSHPLRVHSGEHALAHLPAELDRLKLRRAFVLCGRSLHDSTTLIDTVGELLGPRFAGVYADMGADVDSDRVEQAAALAREVLADCLIAVGAGSTTKACRVVAIRMAEEGPLAQLATRYDATGVGTSTRLHAAKLPIFNVLTAATTSQNRSGASIRDRGAGRQLEFFDPKTRATAVFWDAQALLTAPLSLTRSAAGMEFWWALMNLAGARHENPLVLASRRQCWEIANEALPRVDDPRDWRVRVDLCAASLLRTRDEDDGGAPLGVLPGTHELRMQPVTRAAYMLAQSLFNTGTGVTQSQATMALAAPAIRAFGEWCPQAVSDIADLLGASSHKPDDAAALLSDRLRDAGFAIDLKSRRLTRSQCEQAVRHALRTFNCNADGWMNDKTGRLHDMLNSVT